jgi:succinate dehydrogenase/fumarate reductase flavoprotein subunit
MKLEKLADKIFLTDVLIIGSEGAGARAALEAAKYDVTVTCVTKGFLAKSGATLTAGTDIDVDSKSIVEVIGMEGDVRDSKQTFLEDIVIEGDYVNDQKIVERHVQDAPQRIKELLDWGMKAWGPTLAPGHRYPRGIYTTGVEVVRALVSQLRKIKGKIKLIENVMITDLLTYYGKISGAVGIDIASGNFVVFRAKAVILATGGGQRIYPYSTAPEELTGDGQAMAYRAGAELMDIQFVQFLTSTFKYPPVTTISVNPMLVSGVWLLNNRGDRFMRFWDPERLEASTRDVVASAIMNEIVEGRGWEDERGGWVYMSLKHMPDNIIDDFALKSAHFSKDLWENLKRNAIPCFSASHFFCGGVAINENCETTLPGLYAAGEIAAGLNGANRLSGNAITQTQVQGAISGKLAAEYALNIRQPEVDLEQVEEFRNLIFQPMDQKKGTSSIEIKRRIQKLSWENIGVVRNGSWLEEALKEIERLKKDVSEISVRTKTRVYNREWLDALQVRNMIQVVEMIARAALMRTESRGVHYRKDYPHVDNDHWLKNIVLKQTNGNMELTTKPVVITRFKPPAGVHPYPGR